MFCRFCGKQIEDDSLFCAYCGKNLSNDKPQETIIPTIDDEKEKGQASAPAPIEKSETMAKKEPSSWGLWVFLAVFVIFLLISTPLVAAFSKREVTSKDYTITTSQGVTTFMVTVTPERNFIECDVEVTLYNSKGKKIYSDTISKENLKKGSSYTYTFNFGVINSLSGYEVKYDIDGKCRNGF